MVATMIAIALAGGGLCSSTDSRMRERTPPSTKHSSTDSLRRYQTPLSTKNVVPPTIANFSSSRCLISTERSGSGVRLSTVSTTVTPCSLEAHGVYSWSGGLAVLNVRIFRDRDHPARVLVREDPLLERPPPEHRAEQGADDDPADEVGHLDAERRQVRRLQVQHVPREPLRQRVEAQRDAADQEEQRGLVRAFPAAAGAERPLAVGDVGEDRRDEDADDQRRHRVGPQHGELQAVVDGHRDHEADPADDGEAEELAMLLQQLAHRADATRSASRIP